MISIKLFFKQLFCRHRWQKEYHLINPTTYIGDICFKCYKYKINKCNHEWILSGTGFTVCKKCGKLG